MIQLREQDAMECRLLGMTPDQALEDSIAKSSRWWVLEIEDDVVGWWGYHEQVLSGRCVAWMLSTPAIERHKRTAAKLSMALLDWMLDTHAEVIVPVNPEYATAVRWLEWLGFSRIGRHGHFDIMHIQRGGSA